jgi:predicted TIM-barrel fold metal-dependent hydrolase
MIIDTHTHIGTGERLTDTYQVDQSLDLLLSSMAEAGVDRSCVMTVAYADYQEGNREIHEAVRAHPDRLIGFARANLGDRARAEAQIRRCFEEYGFRGLKIHHGLGDGFPTRWLMELLREYRWPLLLHTPANPETIDAMAHLARGYPEVPVILGHMGGFGTYWPVYVKACALEAKEVDNLYLDTAFQYMYQWVRIAVDICGPGKVLFGSDGPIFHPALSLTVIGLCHFSDAERTLLLGGNAERLLRLDES